MSVIVTAVGLVILLCLSAFFSAGETALTSITKVRLRQLRKSKLKKDAVLADLLSDPPRMITTLLVGNNIVNIWSSSIATAFAISMFGSEGIGIATLAMTVMIVVFSEITPKTLAAANPTELARTLGPALRLSRTLLTPIVFVFTCINSVFLSLMKFLMPDAGHRLTEEEIRTMVDVGKEDGALGKEEHDLMSRAFGFTDLSIREIMTPRTDIVALPFDAGKDDLIAAFRKGRFSRIPVYEGSIDSIRGMVHYKDILFMRGDAPYRLESLVRPVLFVPETQKTTELLSEMKKHGQNLAIVIDEHGATAGLVTADDAIGAVFGGIHDEYDTGSTEPHDSVKVLSSDHVSIPGNLKLADLNALLKTALDSRYYETVGGFVMEKAGKLPEKGAQIRHGNLVFGVEEISSRRIRRIDVRVGEDR